MAQTERHRLRIAVDVIYEGTKLSPSAAQLVAKETWTHAHVLAFQDIKNVEVIYDSPDERVHYSHHHSSPEGNYCRVAGGCIEQAQDSLDQDDL